VPIISFGEFSSVSVFSQIQVSRSPFTSFPVSQPDNSPTDLRSSPGRNRTAEQLLREQRLENMGLLAARVAHDLNNMLAPMKMAISMLRPSLSDPAARSLLDSLESTVARATALVGQIMDYAHGAGGQLQLVLMRHLLEEIALFATDTFPRNIQVEVQISQDLWPVNANLSQLHQVLLNLCINARDAMPRGGTLSLRAENCMLNGATAAAIDGGRAGAFLALQVDDTGTGFSPVVMARMWEPFNTTKKGGKGFGLGLSTIRDIIVHHGGFIQMKTVTDKGSSFRIYLPADMAPSGKPGRTVLKQTQPLVKSYS
jgi:two-component system cell cycle sensor histidine kinase/response regulator CckA